MASRSKQHVRLIGQQPADAGAAGRDRSRGSHRRQGPDHRRERRRQGDCRRAPSTRRPARQHDVRARSTAPACPKRCSSPSCSATSRAASPAPIATSPASSRPPHMGTVFLDEIGEMTLRMQGLLLRFLETGELQKVGADGGARHVNVRVIAATNRNLRDMIAQGTFREDLYLPPERHPYHRAAAARAARGHPGAGHALPAAGSSPPTARRSPASSPEAMKALVAYLVAGQRARARERDRAPGGDGPARHDRAARICRRKSARRTTSRFGPSRERRRTVADDLYKRLTEQRESFWTTVYPLFMEREITRAQRARRRAARARRSARQLQDRGAPVQHGTARIQAVPEFPAETRLPNAVQRISLSAVGRSALRASPCIGASARASRRRPQRAARPRASRQRRRAAGARRRCRPVPSCRPGYVIGADDRADDRVLEGQGHVGGRRGAAGRQIALPLINDVQAAGLTPEQLRER